MEGGRFQVIDVEALDGWAESPSLGGVRVT
jgi:hypothetical protein